ncbi:hypothetical protein [Bacillus sp. JJ722]|uniref:hypothetical protein n=1 Tax=Bacillus sp. JJ722 TaxID=3122973 RepID=UPI002FFE9D6A
MDQHIVIQNIPSESQWEKVFHIVFNYCDSYKIIYPNGDFSNDNPLMTGRLDFEKLEGLTIEIFDGMEDSIALAGKLTKEARQLFKLFLSPSFEGDKPDLWWFKLYKKDVLIMTVEDFTVCLIEKATSLLTDNGVDITKLDN